MPGVKITGAVVKKLYLPARHSRKGENGRLLIIAGSKKYHGSLVLAATMAAKLVDLVYVHTTPENFAIIKKARERLAEFIYIAPRDLGHTIAEVDAVLIGPGMMPNIKTRQLVLKILKLARTKPVVLDAGALRVIRLGELTANCIVTPHHGEFKAAFKKLGTVQNLLVVAKHTPATIILKGAVSYAAQGRKLFYNTAGNAGMTKGGTGDVLAGLIAALATKNSPLLAGQAGLYLNGAAGDQLYKKFRTHYSASELIPVAQKILASK